MNDKRSYTEYAVTTATTDFVIGFDDYADITKDTIVVTVNGVLAESQGYAVMRKNAQVITITPAVQSGTVRLERVTDIDESFHQFTAGALFSAKSVDENFEQVRHSQQEVRDGFEFLEFNTNGVISDAKAATDRANAAAELAENTDIGQLQLDLDAQNTDISQLQIDLDAQKLDTGITVTAKNGGIERTQAEKNSDIISIADFDSIDDIETSLSGKRIDLLGRTIVVTAVPSNNTYFNGFFEIGGVSYASNRIEDTNVTNTAVIIGALTPNMAQDDNGALVVIGNGAMQSRTDARACIAIGMRAMNASKGGRYNIALGSESQLYVGSTGTAGTRNVSVGDNSLRFNVQGVGNIAMGRNAAQCLVDTTNNTAIGTNAMSGRGSLKFQDLKYIQNVTPITSSEVTAIGANAAFNGTGNRSTAIGAQALEFGRSSTLFSTAVGYGALRNIGKNEGVYGGTITGVTINGTYTMTATTVTITATGMSVAVGNYVYVRFQNGIPIYGSTAYRDLQIYKVTAVSGNTITMSEPLGVVASGDVTIEAIETSAAPPAASQNTAVGYNSMFAATAGMNNVAVGQEALKNNQSNSNTAVGDFTLVGIQGESNNNTAIGYGALRRNFDGTGKLTGINCVGLGFDTRVSGDNQVSLGNAQTSVYAFGAVQDRSDARDKIIEGDITDAHIDFFNDVEFKRYRLDYRDDYIANNEDGTVTNLDKDGSKARKREHVGVIAQQVEEAMKAHNVDFAGLQHHAVNGGNDVYTVGYQEFIPILGEIVQRQQKQIDKLVQQLKEI